MGKVGGRGFTARGRGIEWTGCQRSHQGQPGVEPERSARRVVVPLASPADLEDEQEAANVNPPGIRPG